MLIATFGPTAAWSGKTITFESEQFTLEGHGPITAPDVMEYDRLGHLAWADEEFRGWVQQLATRGAAPSPAAHPRTAKAPGRRVAGLPDWAAVIIGLLIVVGLLVVVLAVVSAHSQSVFGTRLAEERVRLGVDQLGVAVEMYRGANSGYPPTGDLVLTLIGTKYLTSGWPTNPFTGKPMFSGAGPGDYSYVPSADLQSYTLVGYGKNGQVVVTLPRDAMTGQ